jgi:4-alpha-glucanotransferase
MNKIVPERVASQEGTFNAPAAPVGRATASVIRDPNARSFGILVPVSALRSESSIGIGDTGSVKEAIDFSARLGSKILQFLPINETGGDNSPYLPISNLALDPMLLELTPTAVPGLDDSLLRQFVPQSLQSELNADLIRYDEVKALKLKVLRAAHESFSRDVSPESASVVEEFARFKECYRSELEPYTLFRALVDRYHGNNDWLSWDPEHRDPQVAEAWLADSPEGASVQRDRGFYAYVQWVARRQWDEVRRYADNKGVELMGDIPFGISRNSCDVWAHQELFDFDWYIGAPAEPHFDGDPFTKKWGQNWGSPLYRWEQHQATDFAWWRRRVELTTSIFSSFRFDHALGAFRVYAFPWTPQRNGEFIALSEAQAADKTGGLLPRFFPGPDHPEASVAVNREHGKRFFQMLREAAGTAGIVAEDLGAFVPQYMHEVLDELDIPGIFIPHFHHGAHHEFLPVSAAPRNAVATFGTHDNEPIAAYYKNLTSAWFGPHGHQPYLELKRWMRWIGEDQEPPADMTPELHACLLGSLLNVESRAVILNLPDLLGTEERWNSPGVVGGGNWTVRMEAPFSELEREPGLAATLAFVGRMVKDSRRIEAPKATS